MNNKLKAFILSSILLSIVFFFGIINLYMKDTSKNWLIIFGFLLYSIAEQQLIFRLTGVKPNTNKKRRFGIVRESAVFNHKQLDQLKLYWAIASVVLWVVGLAYVVLEHPADWEKRIGWVIFAAPVIAFIDYVQNKRSIKGYRGKELFK